MRRSSSSLHSYAQARHNSWAEVFGRLTGCPTTSRRTLPPTTHLGPPLRTVLITHLFRATSAASIPAGEGLSQISRHYEEGFASQ